MDIEKTAKENIQNYSSYSFTLRAICVRIKVTSSLWGTTMRIKQTKQFQIPYPAVSFLLPLLGLLLLRLICTVTYNGEYSMLYSDCYHQYYPFFVTYRKALLSGESLLYSWSVGMGLDYLGLIAYYLASPLNLLSVLVPEGWLLGYFSLLMPIKLSFANLFFALFLKKILGKNDFSICLFGTFYALCAWALGYQWNIMWLDTFALLPLVMLGMVRMLQSRKFVLYTVSLFLAVVTNYYIGLFVCIFVFLSFFCYEICTWKGFRRFFGDLLCIALFSILALGMTAFLTIPAFQALNTTQSSVNRFPEGFQLNIASTNTWKGLLDAMRQVAGNMNGGIELTFKEGLPNLYCGIIANTLAFAYLACGKVRLREKLCCVGLLLLFNVSFVVRALDFIWHGFHFTNMIPYRFSFLYSFVVLFMAYQAWTYRSEMRIWQVILAGVCNLGLVFLSKELQPFLDLITGAQPLMPWNCSANIMENLKTICVDSSYLLFNLLFVAAYVIALTQNCQKAAPPADEKEQMLQWIEAEDNRVKISTLVLLSVMGVELIMLLINFGIWFPGTNVSNYPKGTKDAQAVVDYMEQAEVDSDFYRAETTHSQTLNDGAINGYNGVSTFTSSANVKVTEFMRSLGYGAKNTYNRYCFEDSSPVANLFLNLKYMIDRDGSSLDNGYFDEVYASGNIHLLKNNAYLPLGFLTNAQLLNLNFTDDSNRFQFQNNLMSAATGVTKNTFNILSGYCLTIVGNDLTLNSQNQTGYCTYETGNKAGDISYYYVPDQDGLFCFYLDQSKRNNFSVYLNGSETALYSESYSLPQMLSVCTVSAGEQVEIRFRCPSNQSGTINLCAAMVDDAVFRQGYEILNASTLDVTSFENTRIEGTITCDRDGILYTSIPQNGNWQATVDGQPVQTVLIGNAMVGLNLSEGFHQVTFTYHNRDFSLGCMISGTCLAVFLVCYWIYYQPSFKRKKGKYER